MDMCVDVYLLTDLFPTDERFGLISQIKRCVVSIASNIVEGAGRISKNGFKHFLSIAVASSYELETQITLANRFNYFNKEKLEEVLAKLDEVQKMITGLQKSLSV